MSWAFGTIDFETYGVMVSRSSGVLDLPKLQTEGYNWLDEDGLDYWQEEPKYNDREIILNCWISAEGGYGVFEAKLRAFTSALKEQGKTTFQTPYIELSDCSISSGVVFIRETNYVLDVQVGTFTLRITVHGDSPFTLVSFNHRSGSPIIEVVKTKNLTVNKTLQGEFYANMTVESNRILNLKKYDYVNINSNGVDNEKFLLFSNPEFTKSSSNKYIYNFRLEHQTLLLRQSSYLFEGEGDFYFYGNLEDIIDLLCENSDRHLPGKFQKGTIVSTIKKNHKFSAENCYDVLKRIVSEYELEFHFQLIPGDAYYFINIDEQIGNTKEITLEYGKGNGLYSLTRERPNSNELCTVLYAYGAAKNLKPTYRGGLQRLSFTGNPLEKNVDLYGRHEKIVYFEDNYPQRTSTVTAYLQKMADQDPEQLSIAEKEAFPGGIYRITDSSIDFDINDYLLGGLTAKVRMKTGNLAGFEFEIEMYDHDYKHIYIIPQKDERGGQYPSADLRIEAGDEYTLVDIDQPETYVSIAETELKAVAQEYIDKWSIPYYPYKGKINPAFLLLNPGGFDVGDKITVVDADYAIDGLRRISALIYNVCNNIYDLTLLDFRKLNRRELTENRIKRLERSIEDTDKETVESMRKEKETATELRNRLFDPSDDLQDVDRTVRDESIDPRMLAHDSGVPQFSLRGALVQPNIDDDANKVIISSGKLIHHNFYNKNRYEIKKLIDQGEDYDPTRTWDVQEKSFTLSSDVGHFIYAKVPLAEGEDQIEIFIEEDHVRMKHYIYDEYLLYKLGHLEEVLGTTRKASMLWGNSVGEMEANKATLEEFINGSDVNKYVNPEHMNHVEIELLGGRRDVENTDHPAVLFRDALLFPAVDVYEDQYLIDE